MLKPLITSFAAAFLLAGCNASEIAVVEDSPATEAAATAQAAGLLTETSTAVIEGETVPRDADGRPAGYALLGKPLPAFAAPMTDGGVFDTRALGHWTVIAVWGAWCTESVADGPFAEALSRAIAQDPDLDFVSVHVPPSAERTAPEDMFGKHGTLQAYFDSAGYSLPVVLDRDGSLREALEISWTPTYLVVSPDGIVRGFRTDLSVDPDQPVKSFIQDIARLRGEVRAAALLVMSPAGVAALGKGTPFTVLAVEKAFPGYGVIPITHPATGAATFEVRPSGRDTARFIIESDWTRGYVALVRSRDPAVRGPAGEVIGQTLLGALPAEARTLCAGAEPGLLVCPDPAAPATFFRVYSTPAEGEPESSAVLTELRYLAPAP